MKSARITYLVVFFCFIKFHFHQRKIIFCHWLWGLRVRVLLIHFVWSYEILLSSIIWVEVY